MESFLSYGSIGVGLAGMIIAVKLLYTEQKRDVPRTSMLMGFYTLILVTCVLAGFGFMNERSEQVSASNTLPTFSIGKGSHEESPDKKLVVLLDRVYIGVNDNVYADIRLGVAPNENNVYKLIVNQGYSDVFSINGNEYAFTINEISESGNLITVGWGKKL
ncbi:hypothetical protein M3I01_017200 [Marinomonas sp. RSW2]|uniref:Uncharacterized protein n=1 Tax=Marinomonas maritima TaxID=2940935 RepID=A0ABT5WIF8_9GAMM|nr:hypothetical protein [Marinomonas maritima]MDE8604598.1 hypothetical protein [Marinomonas maritima]